VVIIFLSCTTAPPVSKSSEPLISFASIEDVVPQWLAFSEGIDYLHGKITAPRLEYHALRINLFSSAIEIVVKGGAASDDESVTLSTKVSSFVRDNELIAGINASPFDITSSRERQPIKNIGIVVSDGKLLSPVNKNFDAFVLYKDGSAAIVSQSSIESIEDIKNAVGGFRQILKNGELTQRAVQNESRHPRSAVGISADGRFMYLLVIDGRRSGSIGATEKETAVILQTLGSFDGINLDGGGSSALVLRYPDNTIKTVNRPIHNGIPGMERAVAGCIGILLNSY